MTSRVFVLLIWFALTSCGRDSGVDDYRVVTFSHKETGVILLKGTKYQFDELIAPRQLILVDSLLVISDNDPKKLLHVVDPKDNTYIRKIGQFGGGPGEIQRVWRLLPGIEPGTFWTFNPTEKRISQFNLNDTASLAIRQIIQQGDFFSASEVTWGSDSTFLTIRTDGWEKFVEYNLKGDVINTYGSWRGLIDRRDVPASILSSLHQGTLTSDTKRGLFLKTCIQRDMIELFDIKTRSTISIRGPFNEIPEFKIDHSAGYPMPLIDNFKYCYLGGYIGDKNIYALFSGNDVVSVQQTGEYCRKVYVFDLNGKIEACYLLDHSVEKFTVDEKNGKIYAITFDSEPNIVGFNLPGISK